MQLLCRAVSWYGNVYLTQHSKQCLIIITLLLQVLYGKLWPIVYFGLPHTNQYTCISYIKITFTTLKR